eukprot:TRINITY_DN5948_c0_g1_i1.p1 TRINITY_DN5948_c0_g1~~TRINITY_DN5948_c0_g1_i1.p1  ORF type:complete len:964 (+),score=155.52 TRINITY_DN5948_c0_g1_i1:172-2892(+)
MEEESPTHPEEFPTYRGQWRQTTSTNQLPITRTTVPVTLLDDGRALVVNHIDREGKTQDVLVNFNKEPLEVQPVTTPSPHRPPSNLVRFTATLVPGKQNSVTAPSKVVVFGGLKDADTLSNEVYSFNVESQTWEAIKTLGYAPVPRDSHSATYLGNGIILFFGGRIKDNSGNFRTTFGVEDNGVATKVGDERPNKFLEETDPRKELKSGFRTTNEAYTLDTNKWKWKKLSCEGDIPSARAGHSAVLLSRGNKMGSLLHVFGGMTYSMNTVNPPHYTFLDDSYVLDIDQATWREINRDVNKPLARAFHSTTIVNGHIYLFGGLNYHLGSWLYPTDIHYLVPDTGSWYTLSTESDSSISTPQVYGHSAFALGCDLVIYGNSPQDNPNGSSVYVLDTEHKPTVTMLPSTQVEDMNSLLKSGLQTDINFILNDGYAKGHKIVIGSRSPALAEMCDQVMQRRDPIDTYFKPPESNYMNVEAPTEVTSSTSVNNIPSRYKSNYVELKNINLKEFQIFLKLLYTGHVEVIGDGNYYRLLELLDKYEVEYKGRKLRENEALRVLRAAGVFVPGRDTGSMKSVYVLRLPRVGLTFKPSKKDPMPYADIIFRVGGESLRSSRGHSYTTVDQNELEADKVYLAKLRNPGASELNETPVKNIWTFYAGHKAILCARCKYFNTMSLQDTFTIHFDDQMDKEVFRIFLNYIYDGSGLDTPQKLEEQLASARQRRRDAKQKKLQKLQSQGAAVPGDYGQGNPLSEELSMLLTLLTLSGKYGLDDLKIHCEILLFHRLNFENVLKVFQCACSSGANQLKQVCITMIVENITSIYPVKGNEGAASLMSVLSVDAAEELFNYVDSRHNIQHLTAFAMNAAPVTGQATPATVASVVTNQPVQAVVQERLSTLAATETIEDIDMTQ